MESLKLLIADWLRDTVWSWIFYCPEIQATGSLDV